MEEMVLLLRYMIDDVDTPQKYTDERLASLLAAAAQFVYVENEFVQTYTISVMDGTIDPDPTEVDTRDDSFINLTVLKAACLLASSPLMKSSRKNISVRENQYQFDGRSRYESDKFVSQTFCQNYLDAKWEFTKSGGTAGYAIIGPYRSLMEHLDEYDCRR